MRPNGLTSRRQIVLQLSTPRRNEIRTAEVIGSRCLAADLAIGLPTSPFGDRGARKWPFSRRELMGIGHELGTDLA